MRNFNYEKIYAELLTPEIVQLLVQIHEHKGQSAKVQEYELTHLVEIARIQSTQSANRIEGIYTSDDRLQKLVKDKTMPRDRSEKEIAGYRDVLSTIHESYEYIPVRPGMILQFHRELYKYSGTSMGGKYRTPDNVIEEEEAEDPKHIRFQPVPAREIPEAVDRLCRAYNDLCSNDQYDPLLMIPVFILEFLRIHPFNNGNGRMSRLLTLLLLYRAGCHVGKYISMEKLIERTKGAYYDALQESSFRWLEEENNYIPFVTYQKDGEDKDKFYIFDFCGNFEFFRMSDGKPTALQIALQGAIFSLKAQIIFKLQDLAYQTPDLIAFRQTLVDDMVRKVRELNKENFAVRQHLPGQLSDLLREPNRGIYHPQWSDEGSVCTAGRAFHRQR